jgi:hypothetical protein
VSGAASPIPRPEPERAADLEQAEPAHAHEDDNELIMSLERDQFVAETSKPVARAPLSARVSAGLWALRVFVVIVSAMVIYTFVDQLH